MPLIDLQLLVPATRPPAPVTAFLREAARRIRRFRSEYRIPGFVPSDFARIYKALAALSSLDLAGNHFCEWGSGFGVVSCLAAMLGFDACGIEIEDALVEASQQLADDFELPVEFLRGSFIPHGAFADRGTYSWLKTCEASGHDDPGVTPDECDLIFAYPWPDEETVIEELFERFAADGALLLTYHDIQPLRLRQKTAKNGQHRQGTATPPTWLPPLEDQQPACPAADTETA